MISLDFSSVPDRTPLDEGTYDLIVEKAEETTAKSSGSKMLAVTFACADDTSRKLWENFPFSEKALWKLKDFLRSLGHQIDDNHPVIAFEPEDLVGGTVRAKVILDTYNGQPVNRIKSFVM
jgi:hypothetical protein